tara:strand:+ start:315 stop:470 length:156 start_codon:yes stop_codon:yes gene_type:complete
MEVGTVNLGALNLAKISFGFLGLIEDPMISVTAFIFKGINCIAEMLTSKSL